MEIWYSTLEEDVMGDPNQAALEAALREMQGEGQGVWQVELYPPESVPVILAGAIAGDVRAIGLVRLVGGIMAANLPCLLCDTTFSTQWTPHTLVLVTAARDDANQAVGNGLCTKCCEARSLTQLKRAVFDYWKANCIPDARVIDPAAGAGHA